MRKVLIIHHVEEIWEGCYEREELCGKIIKHVRRARYDEVILTVLERFKGCVYEELEAYVNRVEEWMYGYEPPAFYASEAERNIDSQYRIKPEDIIPVSSHHDYAYLYQWIKDLKGSRVYLAGGHREECLLDLQETLEHLGIRYRNVEQCIYG